MAHRVALHVDRGDGRPLCGAGELGGTLGRCVWCQRDGQGQWTRQSARMRHREVQSPKCARIAVAPYSADCELHTCGRCEKRRDRLERAERGKKADVLRREWPKDWGPIRARDGERVRS